MIKRIGVYTSATLVLFFVSLPFVSSHLLSPLFDHHQIAPAHLWLLALLPWVLLLGGIGVKTKDPIECLVFCASAAAVLPLVFLATAWLSEPMAMGLETTLNAILLFFAFFVGWFSFLVFFVFLSHLAGVRLRSYASKHS